jgi:general secretion pathway protein K
MSRPRFQRGAALLMAMLTVTLVATFAAAAMWQQWRSVEVEQAERTRVQSGWILTGALDWARLILKEDGKTGAADYLSEPWAVPLEEARLSTFLAAENGVASADASDADGAMNAFLSGQIIDLQSMLNVNNLAQGGQVSQPWVGVFTRLFEQLGLPTTQLATLVENLRFASDTSAANRSAPLAPLMPQRVEQLAWLGLPAETVSALRPYVTIFAAPTPTAVNLNTAPAEVIYAALEGISLADAQRLVTERGRSHFSSVADALTRLGRGPIPAPPGDIATIGSSYFESRGRLRMDKMVVEERSLIYSVKLGEAKALRRERGVIDAPAPGAAFPAR